MKRNSTTTLNALSISIDNLRVYDTRVLSASEVKEIYEAENKTDVVLGKVSFFVYLCTQRKTLL